jgi:hypothetical protein
LHLSFFWDIPGRIRTAEYSRWLLETGHLMCPFRQPRHLVDRVSEQCNSSWVSQCMPALNVVRLPCPQAHRSSDVLYLTYLVENTSAVTYHNNTLIGSCCKILSSSGTVGHPLIWWLQKQQVANLLDGLLIRTKQRNQRGLVRNRTDRSVVKTGPSCQNG